MRLLSWNIQWARGIDGRVDLDRAAAVIREKDADVICLQEVAVNHPGLPGGAGGDQPAGLASRLPGYRHVYGVGSDLPDDSGGRRLFGNMVLTRMPLLQVFRHLLPWPADPAVPGMQRVAVEAAVDTPIGALRVVTTHLEYYSRGQREAQVEGLRALQAEGYRHAVAPCAADEADPPFAVLPRGTSSVFCGDFNFPAGAPEWGRLQAEIAPDVPRLVDAWTVAHPGEAHLPTAGVHGASFTAGPECFDFFFVSENLRDRVAALQADLQTSASDHQPLWLDLSV